MVGRERFEGATELTMLEGPFVRRHETDRGPAQDPTTAATDRRQKQQSARARSGKRRTDLRGARGDSGHHCLPSGGRPIRTRLARCGGRRDAGAPRCTAHNAAATDWFSRELVAGQGVRLRSPPRRAYSAQPATWDFGPSSDPGKPSGRAASSRSRQQQGRCSLLSPCCFCTTTRTLSPPTAMLDSIWEKRPRRPPTRPCRCTSA